MLAATGIRPSGLDGLLAAVGADPGACRGAPWYAGAGQRLSTECGADEAARVRTALASRGIEFLGLGADVVPEARFNAALAGGNKAEVLFDVSAGVFERLATLRRPAEQIAAVFDRHGGRRFYAPLLQRRWPASLACALGESPARSDYRLAIGGSSAHVRFEVEADGNHPQVGLASMLAKCLRERFMGLFNAHFAAICPGVAPTAGYTEDGRRWLDETRAARLAAGVPDSALVRNR
jgi:hypothetical protein